jgi:hypothetical protein
MIAQVITKETRLPSQVMFLQSIIRATKQNLPQGIFTFKHHIKSVNHSEFIVSKYCFLHKFVTCFSPSKGCPWVRQHKNICKGR